MNAAQVVLIGCGVLATGAVLTALLSPRRSLVGPLAFLATLAAALLIFPAALGVLLGGGPASTTAPVRLPS
ncbi:hypothetical protein, partial [Hydrogenophaga sp.]|uniref:hypothetical protein n=1 Tax=Hydrogenophaga sp. TaxID=1904254 RepID=UPI00169A7628